MLKIDDRNLEKQITEILKRTGFEEPRDYLAARVTADLKLLKQNRKLSI
jgi:hypothetical protein